MIARITWHRPLLVLALGMMALAIWSAVGIFVDPRIVTGAPLWAKPFKFAVSISIYSLTLSWLIGMLTKGRRLAWWLGTIAAIFLAVEIVIIVGAAASDTTSHFNVSTPFHAALWAVMAVSIVIVWSAAIPLAVMLFRTSLGDAARTIAIRGGLVVALIGMALGFLMTFPSAAQLADYHGIVGAHTVGLSDGGPGLPLLGWSTVGGDLRIPHFVGMHALQLIPLSALVIELLARRIPVLRVAEIRRGIVVTVIALYLVILTILTVQAEVGQSIVHPSAPTIAATAVACGAAAAAVAVTIVRGRPRRA
jgi:hypothetical protein